MFELDEIKIHLAEKGREIVNDLKKYGKEVSRDYGVEIPKDLENITKQELYNWIMASKDKILDKESTRERKMTLYYLLKAYLNAVDQYKTYVKKQGAQMQPSLV